jgi:hypothetical protein
MTNCKRCWNVYLLFGSLRMVTTFRAAGDKRVRIPVIVADSRRTSYGVLSTVNCELCTIPVIGQTKNKYISNG